MKTMVVVVGSFLLAGSLFAKLPASSRRPTQAVLNAPVVVPVIISGKQNGSVTVPKGTVVAIAHVRKDRVMINFQGSQAWMKRTDTDFDQRLAVFRSTKQTAQAQVQQAREAQNMAMQEAQVQGAEDFQQQHANYQNPLDKGAYDQTRSVVDYYDWQGRRYHIGVFGQRIYQ
jgi:hypothetical protein